MRIADLDLNRDILVVAEIGNNHEGSCGLAADLITAAARAGVHAVKLQTFRTADYVSPQDRARYERLRSFELGAGDLRNLAAVAADAGVLFLSTPFDLQSVVLLQPLVAAFKIASGDNTFYPLLEAVAGTGKPILLSTGLADLGHIEQAVQLIERVWAKRDCAAQLALLHCVSAYPVPPEQANLCAITTLMNSFSYSVGYSDHTLGIEACVAAAALGARIIEKHFTLDKQQSDFRDHQLSADPAEMAELVRRVRVVQDLRGCGIKAVQPCERSGLVALRRSVAARRPLDAGETLTADCLTWVRPGGGLPPGEEGRIVGARLKRALQAGERIGFDDVEMPGS